MTPLVPNRAHGSAPLPEIYGCANRCKCALASKRHSGDHKRPGTTRDTRKANIDMGDLYWGDNLEILRTHIPDASVDLIYLDPPFNSNRNYNVLFRENGRAESDAQIEAFTDTWHWTGQAEQTYAGLIHGNNVPRKVSDLIVAMRSFIGSNDVMAYLVMMTIRLLELHRVLKPTGSIYLHCDPTASHYLKVVMDTIWGPVYFRNEIVWRRYGAHNDVGQGSKHFGRVHDVILLYVKGSEARWTQLFRPLSDDAIREQYRNVFDLRCNPQLMALPFLGILPMAAPLVPIGMIFKLGINGYDLWMSYYLTLHADGWPNYPSPPPSGWIPTQTAKGKTYWDKYWQFIKESS